ncbi:c-type cytochrome [Pseudoruegeria sp. HB172150]|uniref:c-type cytochrome n=1 Tax=Pseudoruegeria sp. HB172150 TaxID=2721164 RepID=UPI0015533022|nr:c-type cytochrome [Pseudoruegeria sp. HB172150]
MTIRTILTAALLAVPQLASAQEGFEELRDQCIACHGETGQSETEETPSLGGLDDYYALISLVGFREGRRPSDIMADITADMSNNDLRAAAAWIQGLPDPEPPEAPGDPAIMERGAALARDHHCVQCHGAELRGGHQMPSIRNQREDYLLKALRDYKAERRLGDRAAMVEVVQELGEAELADLAHYVAHLPAE